VSASIKEFIRNWKSILLLLILPLLVIGSFFASFNTQGLQKVPIGIITNNYVELNELKSSLSEILITKEFTNIEDCLKELKQYKQYVCIDINKELAYKLDVHYDNTKTLVIWGVINYIERTVDWIKKEKTKELASKVLEQAELGPSYIEKIRSELNQIDSDSEGYITDIRNSVSDIENNIRNAESSIDSMGYRIVNIQSDLDNLKSNKQTHYSNSINYINSIDQSAGSLILLGYPYSQYGNEIKTKNNQLKSSVNSYNSLVDSSVSSISSESNEFSSLQKNTKTYLDSVGRSTSVFSSMEDDLEANRDMVDKANSNLNSLEYYIGEIRKIDPEQIADPIQLKLKPTYLPEVNPKIVERFRDKDGGDITTLIKGETLLSFQVIFPKILLLIVMFVALLTSTFICLSYLKSPANRRIRTMRHIFFPSFLSIYISSLIITMLPIFCVILLGNFLFLLPFFENILIITIIILISASIYVLVGMSLSYLIKEKSLTLLVSIFTLLFLLFFSGFILPIERMGRVPSIIASNFPGNIASDCLNKLLFYNQPIGSLLVNINMLFITLIFIGIMTLTIKFLRNQ